MPAIDPFCNIEGMPIVLSDTDGYHRKAHFLLPTYFPGQNDRKRPYCECFSSLFQLAKQLASLFPDRLLE